MSHDHHHHTPTERIGTAFFINLAFTIIEFIGGILTNSTAIMADAVHDLGDSLAIGMAWVMQTLSDKAPSSTYSYGYRRLSLVAAFVNALILLIGSVWIIWQAVPRLFEPQMPIAEGMIALGIIGVIANGYAAYRLSGGHSMNEKVLNWHLLEDVLGWVAVLIVAIILMFVDWPILDPLLSIAFTGWILVNVVRNLTATIKLFVQATPNAEHYQRIHHDLSNIDGVDEIHHLHFWSLDGERHVLTAHLVLNEVPSDAARRRIKQQVDRQLTPYELAHTTIELEYPDEPCRDDTSEP